MDLPNFTGSAEQALDGGFLVPLMSTDCKTWATFTLISSNVWTGYRGEKRIESSHKDIIEEALD